MITITTDEILFFELYRDSKKMELVQRRLIFLKTQIHILLPISYIRITKFGDTINKDSGELIAFYIGEK
jgi:hypothetical protein